ncbi:acyltransferase family protein [Winogradskyella forsetii]|uniref:acyltransferase family protein n=1 Tax=Winogradskyella forsetii TaxID=2686077 RepID=UPI0015B8FC13|nr:acyltransferase family protein [Winogradskyella forsetii]
MKTIPSKTERLHALDSLRAIMMLLGVVLHSVITYIGGEPYAAWPIRDPNNFNTNLEWISSYIHVFRMPIFMVVAGFFAALLFYERGTRQMFKNRMSRIALPFLVFVILLFVPVAGGMKYTLNIFASVPNALAETTAQFTTFSDFVPTRTLHLWFLYYLIMFSLVSFLLGLLFKKLPKASQHIHIAFHYIFKHSILRLFVFTFITVLILIFMNRYWVNTSTSFVPDFSTFIFYFFFYMFGWLLFKSKSLLKSFMKHDWLYTILGTLLFTWYFIADTEVMDLWVIITIRSLACWLLTFGFTGLFVRYGSHHSARMRYISDASYWVYLLHLPLTIIIPALIAEWNISGVLKFLFVTLTTSSICFVTYHYFVRNTFIGKFLNGKKYSRRISDIKHVEISKMKLIRDK